MKLTANIIGATGLVGKQLTQLLLEDDNFDTVRIFVRRDSGIKHQKLDQQIVDFNKLSSWENKLGGDVLFSALGTTLKQAGSKEKEYAVDFTLNLNFAQAAFKNGIKNYVLVSSVGANSGSKLFYPRMKGELDETVAKIGFSNLAILRPSSLTGNRTEKRYAEIISIPILEFITKYIFKNYRPIKDTIVANAMIKAVVNPSQIKQFGNQMKFLLLQIKYKI